MAKRETESTHTPTRKQLAMTRKERQHLRWIYIGLGLVAALIVAVLAAGFLYTYVVTPNAPIATVNGANITTREYQNRVRYERFMLNMQLQQIEAQRQNLLASQNDQLIELLSSQYDQELTRLQQQRAVVDQQTLDLMVEDKLVADEAVKRSLSVSDEEVTETINRFLARQVRGLTAAAAAETVTAYAEASATAALWTPTPTFTPSPTLTVTKEITQPTAVPVNTPTPAPTATPNIIAPDALNTQYTTWLKTLSDEASVDEATYRQIVRSTALRTKLQDQISKEVPKVAEQAHARHILVKTEDEAKKVIERLKAGEDFAKLAAELSQDPGSQGVGGDLDFVPRKRFVAPIDDAIFSLPVGQVSDPIQTDYGWHVVEVLERDTREMSPSDYMLSQRIAYNDWLTSARAAATIEDFWSKDKVPDDPLNQQPVLPTSGQ